MVFVRTKRGADKLVSQLKREGVAAAAIHGDLRQSAREKALKDFQEDEHGVLVATDVAARGIHVDDVDVVVHYDPPEEHKSYVHRSGRTARAGNEGMVVTFVLWNQELEVERLQRRLGMREPIIEVFSNDPRLANLVDARRSGAAAQDRPGLNRSESLGRAGPAGTIRRRDARCNPAPTRSAARARSRPKSSTCR